MSYDNATSNLGYLRKTNFVNRAAPMKNLVVTEEIWKEGNMYTAYCPELDVVSCGRDVAEARKNLLEVIEIQLEETAKLGTLNAFLPVGVTHFRL